MSAEPITVEIPPAQAEAITEVAEWMEGSLPEEHEPGLFLAGLQRVAEQWKERQGEAT